MWIINNQTRLFIKKQTLAAHVSLTYSIIINNFLLIKKTILSYAFGLQSCVHIHIVKIEITVIIVNNVTSIHVNC